jgi:site-specific DNA-adenine methylase
MPFNIETAATYYILSKSVYGGVFTGGIGSCVATPSMMQNIRRFNLKGKLSVEMVDFREAFERHPLMFAYLDPPYILEGKKECYYGEKGILHSQFDHDALFEILKDRPNWIMSYGDHPTVRAMYKGFQMISPSWKYGCSNDKSSRELLIYSKDLSPR